MSPAYMRKSGIRLLGKTQESELILVEEMVLEARQIMSGREEGLRIYVEVTK